MNKLDKFQLKQVQLGFSNKESWIKIRTKVKDSKCENCGKLHSECTGDIALATFKDRMNAHVCEDCGKYLISKGAIDILEVMKSNMNLKDKLIKQANRVGIQFNTYWRKKKAEDYTVQELKDKIANKIKSERSEFKRFLEYKHLDILKEFVDELHKEKYYTDYTYFDAFKNCPDILYEYDTDYNYEHHRWCSYFDATIKVGDKIFSYAWANANGDNSLEDAGFNPDDVWESMSVVNPVDNITTEDMLNWTIDNLTDSEDREVFKNYIKDQIVKNR